jgi:SWI/SNF-related matrix-associated actin-dependent regulator of chromatin subfamily A3
MSSPPPVATLLSGYRLNLTAANHIYILEPQWNPSVETQAIGRVSRLGQNKAVLVTRYLVRGTVEMVFPNLNFPVLNA